MSHLCVNILFKSLKTIESIMCTFDITFMNRYNAIIYNIMMWKQRLLNIGVINIYIQIIQINRHLNKLILLLMTLIHHSSHQCNLCCDQKTFTRDKQHQITLLFSTYQFRYWKTHK